MRAVAIARKMWRILADFVRAKKSWRWPRTSDVLIYDGEGQEDLLEYVAPWNPEVLHVRGERINIPVLLASLPGIARLNRNAYVDCFVRAVSPRLIVTFIDNNVAFYSLAARHRNLKTLFVQNGIRALHGGVFEGLTRGRSTGGDVKVDYMLTFGDHVGREYARFIRGSVVPIGSLKNNAVPRRRPTRPGSLAFISQYRNSKRAEIGGRFYSRKEFFEQADLLVLQFLIQYARERHKAFSIISCCSPQIENVRKGEQRRSYHDEERYYRELLAQDCDLRREKDPYTSYDAADGTEVVVGIDSSLAYESAARGNKTAFFSIRLQPWNVPGRTFGWPGVYPDDGPFWTNRQDPAAFERILDYLFSITGEEWQAQLRNHNFTDIMAFNPGNTALRSVLRRELAWQKAMEGLTPAVLSSAVASSQ